MPVLLCVNIIASFMKVKISLMINSGFLLLLEHRIDTRDYEQADIFVHCAVADSISSSG